MNELKIGDLCKVIKVPAEVRTFTSIQVGDIVEVVGVYQVNVTVKYKATNGIYYERMLFSGDLSRIDVNNTSGRSILEFLDI